MMGTIVLVGIYVACELIANVTAAKPVIFLGFTAPGGVFIYALTFTLVDLLNERLGPQRARAVVYTAFSANVLLAGYTTLVSALPSSPYFTNQAAFITVFGSTPRIVAASLTAYLLSSLTDVAVFAAWKRRLERFLWARVVVSNAVSTALDSIVFVVLAFAGVFPVLPVIVG
jgi:uncharacterized integral membrane protein (TIGR00697 family)